VALGHHYSDWLLLFLLINEEIGVEAAETGIVIADSLLILLVVSEAITLQVIETNQS
jgi:hypothetical protein